MTKELEQAAQEWLNAEGFKRDELRASQMPRYLAEFAFTQLRQQLAELETRGYAGHTKVCNASIAPDHYAGKQVGECDCGLDEMKRELEQQ